MYPVTRGIFYVRKSRLYLAVWKEMANFVAAIQNHIIPMQIKCVSYRRFNAEYLAVSDILINTHTHTHTHTHSFLARLTLLLVRAGARVNIRLFLEKSLRGRIVFHSPFEHENKLTNL